MNRPRPGPCPDDVGSWARYVRRARDDLDPLVATVLTLVYEQDATPVQAAARLGVDVGQVRVALAAGLRSLASTVGGSSFGDPQRGVVR